MYKMDDQKTIQRLIEEFGYSKVKAKLIWQKITEISPNLFVVFEDWWNNGKQPNISIESISFEDLTTDFSMNALAAFLTLDWLTRDPKTAKESLRKGHDIINLK